jgi:hypothetical protein
MNPSLANWGLLPVESVMRAAARKGEVPDQRLSIVALFDPADATQAGQTRIFG